MRQANTVRLSLCAGALLVSGCSVLGKASDYEVDPAAFVRDLDYELAGMIPHAGVALDVAVVGENELLQARARIILPPAGSGTYPTERILMRNTLTPGEQTLYFFADNDGDGSVDGSMRKIEEHIWIESLDPDGVGRFEHNTNFRYFNEDAYIPLNGALVLEMPAPRVGDAEAFLKCLDGKLGKQVDVTLTLLDEDRQVGLFRRYRGTPAPKEIRLNGVLDGGSQYRIEVLVDGEAKKSLNKQAPAKDDLVIAPTEWFPASLEEVLTSCR